MAGDQNPKVSSARPRTPGGRTTAVLVPQGVLAGQPDVPLDRPVTTCGANENARLHLVSRTVSKGHAIFVNSGGTTYVADMASRTGVLVNGKLVKDAELKTGDRVQIGKFVFRYRSPANVAPPPPQPESPPASVIVVGTPGVAVRGRTVIIGRRETSDISVPNDSGVSAAHAVIFQMDGRWYIRDLGSRTGTQVNGSPIHQQELKFGTRITVGSTNILFQPGVAKVDDLEDSFAPQIPAETAAQNPLEEMAGFEPELAAAPEPTPVAADELDDAIPLGDDWRSVMAAQPQETPAEATVEEELQAEPEPVPVAAEPVTSHEEAASELPFADELPLTESAAEEPVAVSEPAEVQPAVADTADALDDFALLDDEPAAAVEPVVEEHAEEHPPAVESPVTQSADAVESPAAESLDDFDLVDEEPAAAIEPVIEEPAEVAEPLAAEEPALPVEIEPAAIVPQEEESSGFSLPMAQEPVEAIDLQDLKSPVAEEPAPAVETEPVPQPEPVAIEPAVAADEQPVAAIEPATEPEPIPEPVAVEEAIAPVEPPPTPTPLQQPEPVAAAPAAPAPLAHEHLLGEVDDFVFVPTAEEVDPNAVPDVIFWGDPELDSVAEQVVAQPATPPVAPPAVSNRPPPSDGEPPSDGGSSKAPPPPGPVSPPDSTALNAAPADDSEASPASEHKEFSAPAEAPHQHNNESAAIAVEDLSQPDIAVAGGGPADLAAVVNVDEPAESDESNDAAPLSETIEPQVSDFQAIDATAEADDSSIDDSEAAIDPTIEAEHIKDPAPSAAASEPLAELEAPVVETDDDFVTPMSEGLGAAFQAARVLMDAAPHAEVDPFDVHHAVDFETSADLETSLDTAAVELLELPVHHADPDATADLDTTTVTAPLPTDVFSFVNVDLESPAEAIVSIAGEPDATAESLELPGFEDVEPEPIAVARDDREITLDEPELERNGTAVLAASASAIEIHFPEIEPVAVEAVEPMDISPIVNADLETPVDEIVSTDGGPVTVPQNFELSGFEDVEHDPTAAAAELDPPADATVLTTDEPVKAVEDLQLPDFEDPDFEHVELDPIAAAPSDDVAIALDKPVLELDAAATDVLFPEVQSPMVEAAQPLDISAVVNAELDAPVEVVASAAEEPAGTFEDVELPGFTDVEAVPLAADDAGHVGAEAVESAIVQSDEAPGASDIHADVEAKEWATAVAEDFAPAGRAVLEAVAVEELAEPAEHLFESRFHTDQADSAVDGSLSLSAISAFAFNEPAPVDDAAVSETDEVDRGDSPIVGGGAAEPAAASEAADHAASSITETPHTTDFAGVVSAHAEAPVDESVTLSERLVPPVESEAVEAPVESNESDLEFLEFGEPDAEPVAETPRVAETPAAKIPAVEKPAAEEPKAPEAASEKPAAPAAPRRGPSLFGFEFEGGSFLGGMPISLADKSAIPVLPKVVPPPVPTPAPSPSFDVRATPPSGLGDMQVPAAPAAPAPAPPAPALSPVVPAPAPTPPRPNLRPTSPPQATRTGLIPSLTGLVSEARSTSGPPVIPPVVKGPAAARPAANVIAPARGLTGATPAQGLGARTVEVFSQLSAPIGVEVFGGRPGNPDQFVVPDIKDTTEPKAADEEPAAEEQPEPGLEDANAAAPAPKVRWSRIPLWVSLMVIIPAAAWLAAPHVIKESSTFTGQLSFAGLKELKEQRPEEYHDFIESQKALLLGSKSEDIRLAAKAILLKDHHQPGFTADATQFAQAVQNQYLTFLDDRVEFTLAWPGQVMASAQVDAVLLALAENDHGLEDARQRALVDADAAKSSLAAVNARRAKLKTEFDALAEKAANKPDTLSVSQNQQDFIGFTDQFNAAHAQRTASESVLAELKSEDPTKPINPDTDKEVLDYKRRLDLLNEQIRIAKSKAVTAGSGTGVGTDVSVAATTQPDSTEDFLLGTLQSQADMWAGKIQRRRDELAVEAAVPAAQRAVNLESAIEKLSIKLTGLQKVENDLKTQLDHAKETAAKYQTEKEAADLAEVQKNEHYTEIQKTDAEQQQAANTAVFKEMAYENCITVAGQTPARFVSETDFRRIAILVVSILAWILFGRLTLGELLRPKLVTGIRPAAAPRGNSPMRVIPWPQPHQLQGLQTGGTEPQITADAGV